jgi:hypothetical protein
MIDSKMGLIPRTVVKSGKLNWDLLGICWGQCGMWGYKILGIFIIEFIDTGSST